MILLIIFIIYNILQIAILPFFIFYLFYRYFSGKNIFGSFKNRIGWVDKTPCKKNVVWIHAVSVGEVLSVQYFIKQLKANHPDSIVYLTVGTLAGKELAQKNIAADYINFMPYDFLPCILLALWRIKPTTLFIIEAEIWPNLLILSSLFKVKKYLINARVSMRSYGRYKVLKFIFTPLLNLFEKIYTQSSADSQRFISLDVKQTKLDVFGNIKTFNVYHKWLSIKDGLAAITSSYKTLFVGSIHPGELDYYIKLFQTLKPKNSNLKMILAPRHFHWKNELETKIKDVNISYFMWTEQNNLKTQHESIEAAINRIFQTKDILLVCKLGELFNLYRFADIFYLGGTFVNIGGHNLLEPAVWSNACIVGQYHQNTLEVANELQAAGGLIKVTNFDGLLEESHKLLANDTRKIQMGQHNFKWLIAQAKEVEAKIQNTIKDSFSKLDF